MFNFKKLALFTALFAFTLSFSVSSAYAQDNNSENHKLTLKVVNAESGEALTNAKIEILGIYESNNTDQEGQKVFEGMATDPHTFKIYADGYETWTKTLIVTKDSKLTVKLSPTG